MIENNEEQQDVLNEMSERPNQLIQSSIKKRRRQITDLLQPQLKIDTAQSSDVVASNI